MDEQDDVTTTLRVSNSMQQPITFHLEPWGEYYPMEAGQEFTVVIRGLATTPEIVITESAIFFWAGSGQSIRLFQGDNELGAGETERTRTPNAPAKPLRTLLGLP